MIFKIVNLKTREQLITFSTNSFSDMTLKKASFIKLTRIIYCKSNSRIALSDINNPNKFSITTKKGSGESVYFLRIDISKGELIPRPRP